MLRSLVGSEMCIRDRASSSAISSRSASLPSMVSSASRGLRTVTKAGLSGQVEGAPGSTDPATRGGDPSRPAGVPVHRPPGPAPLSKSAGVDNPKEANPVSRPYLGPTTGAIVASSPSSCCCWVPGQLSNCGSSGTGVTFIWLPRWPNRILGHTYLHSTHEVICNTNLLNKRLFNTITQQSSTINRTCSLSTVKCQLSKSACAARACARRTVHAVKKVSK